MANASSPPPSGSHGWGLQSLYDGLGDGTASGTDPGRGDGGEYDTVTYYDAWCVQVVEHWQS